MRFKLLLAITIAAALFSPRLDAAAKLSAQEICPGTLSIVSKSKIKFSALEKTFLCGDPESDGWNEIPMAQVKFHLESFLQERAIYNPTYREEGDKLIAELSDPVRTKDVSFNGVPPELDVGKRRKLKHRLLRPRFLNEIENWTRTRLQARGYPCPVVRSRGDVSTGQVIVDIEAGSREKLTSVTVEPIPKLDSKVLRRFDAFKFNQYYNEDFLTLTSQRIEKDGILQNTYFLTECPQGTPVTSQQTFAGKPRLFTFGFGVDTEEYLIFKSAWKHTRIGNKGSKVAVDVYASFKRQEFDALFDWYLFPAGSRWHVIPEINFSHEQETEFHFLSANAKVAIARTWDTQNLGIYLSVGPNLNYVDTFRGAAPGLTHFLSLQYEFDVMSHYFEFYQNDPHAGFNIRVAGDFTSKSVLSDFSAQRFRIEGQYLYNVWGFDPPLIILGVRGAIASTYIDRGSQNPLKLPPNYRNYLGGSNNLRGFSLNELPQGFGALSSAFASFEIRAGDVLPLKIQPFAFVDFGLLGDRAFQFDSPLYFSPGFGIRYPSPIGVFRTTFAHGFKTANDGDPNNTHFQFYFSYGEEF